MEFFNALSEVLTAKLFLMLSILFIAFNVIATARSCIKERRFKRELGKRFEAYVPDKDDKFNHDQDT